MGAFADEIGEGFADRMMGANPLGFVSNRVVENIPGMTLDEWAVMDLIGQQMIALDSSERWNQGEYTVETDDGNLRLTYEIRVDNGSSATSSSNSGFGNIQNGGFTGRINATYLNVRNGPGPEYEQIDRFDFGHNITIIGRNEEGTWVEITNPDGGWISVAYASVDGSISQLPVTYQETGEWGQAGQPTGVVARITFTARLRGGPGTNYRQLDNPDTLPVGEQVDIIGRSGNNNWYKVNVDNRSAWISHLAADIIGNNNIPIMDR